VPIAMNIVANKMDVAMHPLPPLTSVYLRQVVSARYFCLTRQN